MMEVYKLMTMTKIILTQFQSLTNRSRLLMKYEKVLVETHL